MRRILRGIKTFAPADTNIKKYILYALGELTIIVVGILLALQLGQWNDDRNRREAEIHILNEIQIALQDDIKDIESNIRYHQASNESCAVILDHIENDLPYTDSLSHHFSRLLSFSRLAVHEGPYEVLKSQGVRTITNESLRTKIMNMYDLFYKTMRLYEENTFLDESYVADVISTRFDKTEPWRVSDDRKLLDGIMIPNDYEKLKNDDLYKHVVRSKISKNNFLINYFMRDRVVRLDKLIESIKEEIERLK
jgi:hypothetical protein